MTGIPHRHLMQPFPGDEYDPDEPKYEIFHLPDALGRGDLIRLMLEEGRVPHLNYPRKHPEFLSTFKRYCLGDADNPPICEVPFLRHGDLVISRVANIMLYLGPRLGLATESLFALDEPAAPHAIYHMNQLSLTILLYWMDELDFILRTITGSKHPERYGDEIQASMIEFASDQLPCLMEYLERVLTGPNSSEGPWLFGTRYSYPDIVLFHTFHILKRLLPTTMNMLKATSKFRHVFMHYELCMQRPRTVEFLKSSRCGRGWQEIRKKFPDWDNLEAAVAAAVAATDSFTAPGAFEPSPKLTKGEKSEREPTKAEGKKRVPPVLLDEDYNDLPAPREEYRQGALRMAAIERAKPDRTGKKGKSEDDESRWEWFWDLFRKEEPPLQKKDW